MNRIYAGIIMLLIAGSAFASNFGSVEKNNNIAVKRGEPAKFTLLFWTSDDEAMVTLKLLESPENMSVILPDPIKISSDSGSEAVYMSGNYVLATTADVTIMPFDAPPGDYSISVAATAQGNSSEALPERMFKLDFSIEGDRTNIVNPEPGAPGSETVAESEPVQKDENDNNIYIIAALIIIAAASVVIYKYA
jgi:hypothetical protein